jgi:glycine/D-amino acid oxidase-like deaminating enzyme/nitrite reductase/ring-hydroxylating ferredoxin subunit
MIRDSETISVWQEIMPFLNIRKADPANQSFDVIIVGAGITGLSLGLTLQEAGRRCLILEARNIGFGTTSGTTAHLNTVLDTPYPDIISKFGEDNAKLVAKGAAEAIDIIKTNVERNNILCDFEYRNGFLFAEKEQEEKTLNDIYEALGAVGIEASYTSYVPVPLPFTKAIAFTGQAQFHPVNYLLALTEAFQEKGGTILEQRLVDRIESVDDLLEVYAGEQKYTSTFAVYATHIPPGINLLHFRCAPYRSYVLGLELEDESQYPEGLAYDLQDPYHYFRTVYLDNRKVLLVGGNDHKTGHTEQAQQPFTELEAYARRYYSIRSIPYKWSAQYYEPADGLPYIGHLPGAAKNIFVATGYSGNGMIFGTLASRVIADLILKGESEYESLFSPSRIKPVAGFTNFVKENADVVKHFIADRISVKELTELADLSKEEGRVVKYEERKIAVYKDEYGVLKALHPVCPHAGCIVQWNGIEKSWDCPCHGARYDVDGKLLNGPSAMGLKQIPLD